MPNEMTEAMRSYQSAVLTCALAGKLLVPHDLPKLLAAIEHAEATGPILDPTLWIAKSKALAEDKELVKAAMVLRAFMLKMRPATPLQAVITEIPESES